MSAAAQQLVSQVDHNASWIVAAAELMGLAEDDFSCPICMSMIRDPFVTDCGHTFCFQCITMHLVNKKSCPCCSTYVTADKIHPNFLLHKVCSCKDRVFCCTHTSEHSTAYFMFHVPVQVIHKVSQANLGAKADPSERVVQLLTADNSRLKLGEVNKLLQVLWERKVCLEQQDAESNLQLLLHFLRHSK